MDWIDAQNLAQKVILLEITLVPREHMFAKFYEPENPRTHKRYKGLKSYEVKRKGRTIGYVEHTEVSTARKVGRLLFGGGHARRWCSAGLGSMAAMRVRCSERMTRAGALEDLITMLLRDGLIRVSKEIRVTKRPHVTKQL